MESSLKERIAKSLEKANEALKEAETLLLQKLYGGTVSRSYYAVFHATCALLLIKNLEFSKHSAVIAAFGHQFIREGLLDKKYHKILIGAYEARQLAEYDIFKKINPEFAGKIFEEAKEFVLMAEEYTKAHAGG
ncbi:MAG: HEPN domain-containing protein [Candidatus Aquicultor sp.]|nr:HEPN domain-containing protein [Candidatus Aquicultor sp.]